MDLRTCRKGRLFDLYSRSRRLARHFCCDGDSNPIGISIEETFQKLLPQLHEDGVDADQLTSSAVNGSLRRRLRRATQ
ncbi:MAG: hypothetical protein BMS9Abin01_1090 [Gammaproteobacteria bacterium]|nr:MAG: hypothetical protein BMS9Abin01_1090 [Gammaproteobacteria bacterium]